VWKVSYRFNLGDDPVLQGWAIVDNDSDNDWENVKLSLVTGRPVSFIQNLYPPYYQGRPTLPLAIAGIAQAETYESGYGGSTEYSLYAESTSSMKSMAVADEDARMWSSVNGAMEAQRPAAPMPAMAARNSVPFTSGVINTAEATAAGEQFEFTIKTPVTLERRQSAMLPIVEGPVTAEKTLIFSAQKISGASGNTILHPSVSAEITNNTGVKLPAGPITVYDGNIYAGDALMEYLGIGEKRIISWGDDLSVSANVVQGAARNISAVNISGGIMTVTRKIVNERTYNIRSSDTNSKRIVIEHPITRGATLTEPTAIGEQTDFAYRFVRNLNANENLSLIVKEESPVLEKITLTRLSTDSFLSYTTNTEIPANVRAALQGAIELRKKVDAQKIALGSLEAQKTNLLSEEDRTRSNIEAVGNSSAQGQNYLNRLSNLDTQIDKVNADIDTARTAVQDAQKEYDTYLSNLEI
jgi:hypothetical protein